MNLAYSQQLDILCLNETWLDSSCTSNLFATNEYTMKCRKDRKSGIHGGTAIINRNSIPITPIKLKHDFCCAAVLQIGFPLLIICIYNPPKNSCYRIEPKNTLLLLKSLSGKFKTHKTLILGDFNQPETDWSSYTSGDLAFNEIIEYLLENNFQQFVNVPTHKSLNTLDLVWKNFSDPFANEFEAKISHFLTTKPLYSLSSRKW